VSDTAYGLGLIGAGGSFGTFILSALRDVPRASLVAIADTNEHSLQRARDSLGVEHAYTDHRALIDDTRVDVVVVASPPFTQLDIGLDVLRAGKALFMEKPGSLYVNDLRELVDLQRSGNIPATIDYVMRWNPLLDIVRDIRTWGWLGPMRSASFANYAQDETLPSGHWFWDRSKSGGIWVEHGVHFFDLYGVLSGGVPIAATASESVRDGGTPPEPIDQVSGSVVYDNGVVCDYLHAFNRPKAMERQSATVAFERGFVKIQGWIADGVEVEAWTDGPSAEALRALPHLTSSHTSALDRIMNRGDSSWHADEYLKVQFALPWDRNETYRRSVAAGINDLLDRLINPEHLSRVTLIDALRGLAVACLVSGTATLAEVSDVFQRYLPDGR